MGAVTEDRASGSRVAIGAGKVRHRGSEDSTPLKTIRWEHHGVSIVDIVSEEEHGAVIEGTGASRVAGKDREGVPHIDLVVVSSQGEGHGHRGASVVIHDSAQHSGSVLDGAFTTETMKLIPVRVGLLPEQGVPKQVGGKEGGVSGHGVVVVRGLSVLLQQFLT
jgi:hypothetical protein